MKNKSEPSKSFRRRRRKRGPADSPGKIRRVLTAIGTVLTVFLITLSVLLATSITWMFHTWNHLTMNELMYQLNAPMDGTNKNMIMDYIKSCIPLTVFVLAAAVLVFILLRKKKILYRTAMGIMLAAAVGITAYYLVMTWNRLDIGNYAENKSTYSDFIDVNYVDPAETELTFPETKRNLIYIFLESMETTYADTEDGGAFEDATTSTKVTFGQAPKLKIPTKANYNFAGYIVVSGESSININANKAWDIDSDVTVKAKYIAKSYDIIYNTDGGNSIPDGAFCFDQTITSLPTPEKTGYKFLGWKIYQDGVATGDYVVSGQKWQYQNSVTLIACWELNVSENFIYTFRANGKEDVNVTVVEGQTINSDDIPVIEQNVTGYEGTWAYNEELADFSVPASKNITFTVKYSPKQYKITFNTQGGESIADMYVKYDQENVTLPTPVKAGFVFNDSWYLGNDNISVNISKWQLDKDIELTVKWYVTVTFKQTGFADKVYKVMAGDSFNETLIPKCETSTSGVYVWDLEGKNFTNMQNSLVIEAVKLNIDLDWTENV